MLTRTLKMSQQSIMSFFKTKGTAVKSPSKTTVVSKVSSEIPSENGNSEIQKIDSPKRPIASNENLKTLKINSPERPTTSEKVILSPYGHKIPLRKTAAKKIHPPTIKDIQNENSEIETETNSRIPLKEIDCASIMEKPIEVSKAKDMKSVVTTEDQLSEEKSIGVKKNKFKDNHALNVKGTILSSAENIAVADAKTTINKKENQSNSDAEFMDTSITENMDSKHDGTLDADIAIIKKPVPSRKRTRAYLCSSSEEDEIPKTNKWSNKKQKNKDSLDKKCAMVISSSSESETKDRDESPVKEIKSSKEEKSAYKKGKAKIDKELKKAEGNVERYEKSAKIKSGTEVKVEIGVEGKLGEGNMLGELNISRNVETGKEVTSVEDKVEARVTIEKSPPNESPKVKKTMHSFFAKSPLDSKRSTKSSEKLALTLETTKTVATSDTTQKVDNNSDDVINDLNFDPAKNHYDPLSDACWMAGESVPYVALAKTFERIEETSARLRSIEILSNLFRSIVALTPTDLLTSVYLCLNRVAPAYEALELGLGDTLLMKVIAQSAGRSMDQLKIDLQEKGDIGLIAEASRTTQKTMFKPKNLTLQSVFKKLKEIASMTGNSVMAKKVDLIKGMYVACRQSEARYLMRSLSGKLRIGLAEQSVLHALAWAIATGNHPNLTGEALKKKVEEAALIIKRTYCKCPNYDLLIPVLLNSPLHELPFKCKLTPGIPLKPMLAHPTKQIGEVLDRFGDHEFVCEYKYDGERAQIHLLEDGRVEIYSRNQENNMKKYPDVVNRIRNTLAMDTGDVKATDVSNKKDTDIFSVAGVTRDGEEMGPVTLATQEAKKRNSVVAETGDSKRKVSAILDCEAVAWSLAEKQILPFQVLSTRKRKDADVESIMVQVCVFAFDLLYLNGVSLVERPLRERRELMRRNFREIEGEFFFAKDRIASDAEQVSEFLDESIRGNCEGLMVKTLDVEATYEIAKRSRNWLKLKKDYLDGMGDTLDLVVIGGYHGTGKRTGRYGGFLLACYDEENEEYQSICKIGTGFSDADLDAHSSFLKQHVITSARPYYRFSPGHEPDHWFDAVQVWEVKAADLSLSPTHFAAIGLVESDRGISLRFPRFLKIRDDKKPEDSTSSSQVANMYRSQDQIVNQQKNKGHNREADDEDFY